MIDSENVGTLLRLYRISIPSGSLGTILAAVEYTDTSPEVHIEYRSEEDSFLLSGTGEDFADLLVSLRDTGTLLERLRFEVLADLIFAEIEADDLLHRETAPWN